MAHPAIPNAHPIPVEGEEREEAPLTYDEWWAMLKSLYGSAKEAYAEVGGSDAFMRAERAAWDENDEYR